MEPPKRTQDRPKIRFKSDAILVSNLAPLGSPFRSAFGFNKRPKIKAKISPIFDPIFGSFWVPKGFQNGGQNPSLEPQSRPRNPYKTLRTPTLAPRLRPGPRWGSSYRFLDRFLVDFGSQEGFKMEPLGVLWERFFIGLRGLFHGSTVAPVFNSQHDRVFAPS